MRREVRIGTLRVQGPPDRPDRLAASIEQELSRLMAGGRPTGQGAGKDVARAVHAAVRERGLGERPR